MRTSIRFAPPTARTSSSCCRSPDEPAGEADADAIIALETALARLQWTRVQNRDPIKTYNRRTVAELPALTAGNAWPSWLSAVGVVSEVRDVVV